MIKDFFNSNGIEYEYSVSLKKYNTYKVDSKAMYVCFPSNMIELKELIKFLKKEKYKYLILGNGSNVVFAFDYYDGVIIKLDKFNELRIDGNVVTVGAGYSLIKLSMEAINNSLAGLEFAAGIPGSVGASAAMNAGAYNSSMSDIVREVKVMDDTGNTLTLTNKELEYGYRTSYLKDHKEYIVLEVVLDLSFGDKEELLSIVSDRRSRRMDTQPLDKPSAGSVFRNPEGMYAGALIENCGLKGYRINDAMVSDKHANFIVNVGNASGKDIEELIYYIKDKVLEKYNVELKYEQIIIK